MPSRSGTERPPCRAVPGCGLFDHDFDATVLRLAHAVGTAFAQDSWVFNNEIPCATAPVYGVPFNRCWTSNVRTFRIGNVQSWRLTYTDSKSEFAIGLYRLVAAHGVGGLSAVSGSSAVDWLRSADALKNVTTGASGWTVRGSTAGDHYVSGHDATVARGRRLRIRDRTHRLRG